MMNVMRRRTFRQVVRQQQRHLCQALDKEKILQPELSKPFRQQTMDQSLPGVPLLKPASQLKVPQTEMSTLSNGLRIVTQETYGQASTLGLFIDAGSCYEDSSNYGVSHMIEHLSFKSTTNRSHAEIVRQVETIGGNLSANSGREQIVLSIDILRDYVTEGIDLLADTVLHPSLLDEEIESIRTILNIELENIQENPQGLVQERMHEAAYGATSPLGHSLHAPQDRIAQLSASTVRNFMAKYFSPQRMVLAGAGVEHGRMVELAQEKFGDFRASAGSSMETAGKLPLTSYCGGEVRIHKPDSDFSYAALAFETGGWHSEDLVPVCVLQMLLGGGDSFSAGGPGKGT